MNPPEICLDGGPSHCWQNTGLDVVKTRLVHTGRCVWCQKATTRVCTAASEPIRAGIRMRP